MFTDNAHSKSTGQDFQLKIQLLGFKKIQCFVLFYWMFLDEKGLRILFFFCRDFHKCAVLPLNTFPKNVHAPKEFSNENISKLFANTCSLQEIDTEDALSYHIKNKISV